MSLDKCTLEQFNGIYAAIHKTRSSSETVTVNKQALLNLLEDHDALQGANMRAAA